MKLRGISASDLQRLVSAIRRVKDDPTFSDIDSMHRIYDSLSQARFHGGVLTITTLVSEDFARLIRISDYLSVRDDWDSELASISSKLHKIYHRNYYRSAFGSDAPEKLWRSTCSKEQ